LEKKWEQWKRQEDENRFFMDCLRILNDLTAVVIEVSESLIEESGSPDVQRDIRVGVSPASKERVFQMIHKLQRALVESQGLEIRARVKWDSRSNRPCLRAPSSRWI
jgi:hypothetical protein